MLNAPLWRIMLGLLVLAWVVQRATVATLLALDGQSTFVVAVYGAQAVGGVGLWAVLLWATAAIVPALIALGVLMVTGAIAGGVTAVIPPSTAIAQVVVAVIGTALFTYVARRAIEDDSA